MKFVKNSEARKPESRESITRLIDAAASGDVSASNELWNSAYGDVRRMASAYLARERVNPQLQPTMLVHEVFLRIWSKDGVLPSWDGRKQFFGNIGRVMGQYLVDHARRRDRIKHGGNVRHHSITIASGELASFDVALSEETMVAIGSLSELEETAPRAAEVAWLRFVLGLTIEQTALALDISERTVVGDWSFARAWLRRAIAESIPEGVNHNESP
jgi:RNA polymerase sigma factor (TIGR02999 family)